MIRRSFDNVIKVTVT